MALGASGFGIDCEKSRWDIVSEQAEAREIPVSVVDLTNGDPAAGIDRLPADAASTGDYAAPFLFLGPRVASILKDVFGQDPGELAPSENTDPAGRSSSMSPLAERTDIPPAVDAETSIEVGPSIPRIQRDMYRTDI